MLRGQQLGNFILRASNPAIRFILTTILAKHFGANILGEFTLFNTTVNIILYVVGLDFYTYSVRELLTTTDKTVRSIFLSSQFSLYIILYLLIAVLYILEVNLCLTNLDTSILGLIFCISISDHLSVELYRILTAFKQSILASFIMWLRSSSWAIIFLGVFFSKNIENHYLIYYAWSLTSIISVFVGLKYIFSRYTFRLDLIDWSWIRKGIKISLSFLMTTLAMRVIEYSNRYIIDAVLSRSELGVFSFYSSLAGQLLMLVDSTIIVTMLPIIIEKVNQNHKDTGQIFKQFQVKVFFATTLGCIGLFLASYPLLYFIDNEWFLSNQFLLVYLLVGQFFMVLSMIPYHLMYSLKTDQLILFSTIIPAILGLVLSIYFVKELGLQGAGISFVVSGFLVFLCRYLCYRRAIKRKTV